MTSLHWDRSPTLAKSLSWQPAHVSGIRPTAEQPGGSQQTFPSQMSVCGSAAWLYTVFVFFQPWASSTVPCTGRMNARKKKLVKIETFLWLLDSTVLWRIQTGVTPDTYLPSPSSVLPSLGPSFTITSIWKGWKCHCN